MNQMIVSVDSKGRKMLSIAAKKTIIKMGENGLSHQKIAAMFGIGRSTVTKIISRKKFILGSIYESLNGPRRYIKKSPINDIEVKLFTWSVENSTFEKDGLDLDSKYILARKASKSENKFKDEIKIDDLMNKAKELALEIGLSGFKPTDEWFDKFTKKFNIRFKRCSVDNIEHSSDGLVSDKSFKLESSNEINLKLNTCNHIVKSNIPVDLKLKDLNSNYSLSNNYKYHWINSPENYCSSMTMSPFLYNTSLMNFNNLNFTNIDFNPFAHDNTKIVIPSNMSLNNSNVNYNPYYGPSTLLYPYLFNSMF